MRKMLFPIAAAAMLAVALAGCASQPPSGSSATDGAAQPVEGSASQAYIADLGEGTGITEIGIVMVEETPNFQVTFSNPTSKDVDVDLSKFILVKEDGSIADFNLGTKTLEAHHPRSQSSFITEPNSMKVGDRVSVSYDGTPLGIFEVGEF